MSDYDRAYVAEIANFIFDDNLKPDDVDDRIAKIVSDAFFEVVKGSEAFRYVPHPAGIARPGIGWLAMQGVQIFWRTQGRRRISETVRRTVKLKWRSAYDEARLE